MFPSHHRDSELLQLKHDTWGRFHDSSTLRSISSTADWLVQYELAPVHQLFFKGGE
jgi:hypothetical protein